MKEARAISMGLAVRIDGTVDILAMHSRTENAENCLFGYEIINVKQPSLHQIVPLCYSCLSRFIYC